MIVSLSFRLLSNVQAIGELISSVDFTKLGRAVEAIPGVGALARGGKVAAELIGDTGPSGGAIAGGAISSPIPFLRVLDTIGSLARAISNKPTTVEISINGADDPSAVAEEVNQMLQTTD